MSRTVHLVGDLNTLFDRGFEDRKAGRDPDLSLWEDQGPRGRAYRDGNRARRRDEEAGIADAEIPPRNLTEPVYFTEGDTAGNLRAMFGTIGKTASEIASRAQKAEVEAIRPAIAQAIGIPEERLYAPRDPLTQVSDSSALHGFDPPGRKKRKAPKPADTDQLDLL